jgi:hypothetical protein
VELPAVKPVKLPVRAKGVHLPAGLRPRPALAESRLATRVPLETAVVALERAQAGRRLSNGRTPTGLVQRKEHSRACGSTGRRVIFAPAGRGSRLTGVANTTFATDAREHAVGTCATPKGHRFAAATTPSAADLIG